MPIRADRRASKRIMLKNVRCEYPHLFEPWSYDGKEKGKYSVQVVMPKTHPQLSQLQRAVVLAAKARFPEITEDGLPEDVRNPIRDGGERADVYPDYAGCVFFNVKSPRAPYVGNSKASCGGCSADVELDAYPYEFNGNKGVAFGLYRVNVLESSSSQPEPALESGGAEEEAPGGDDPGLEDSGQLEFAADAYGADEGEHPADPEEVVF